MARRGSDAGVWIVALAVIAAPFIWAYESGGWFGLIGAIFFAVVLATTAVALLSSSPVSRHEARNMEVFAESARIVARTKRLDTARSRYELMLKIFTEGGVISFKGAINMLEEARVKVESMELAALENAKNRTRRKTR